MDKHCDFYLEVFDLEMSSCFNLLKVRDLRGASYRNHINGPLGFFEESKISSVAEFISKL